MLPLLGKAHGIARNSFMADLENTQIPPKAARFPAEIAESGRVIYAREGLHKAETKRRRYLNGGGSIVWKVRWVITASSPGGCISNMSCNSVFIFVLSSCRFLFFSVSFSLFYFFPSDTSILTLVLEGGYSICPYLCLDVLSKAMS